MYKFKMFCSSLAFSFVLLFQLFEEKECDVAKFDIWPTQKWQIVCLRSFIYYIYSFLMYIMLLPNWRWLSPFFLVLFSSNIQLAERKIGPNEYKWNEWLQLNPKEPKCNRILKIQLCTQMNQTLFNSTCWDCVCWWFWYVYVICVCVAFISIFIELFLFIMPVHCTRNSKFIRIFASVDNFRIFRSAYYFCVLFRLVIFMTLLLYHKAIGDWCIL